MCIGECDGSCAEAWELVGIITAVLGFLGITFGILLLAMMIFMGVE